MIGLIIALLISVVAGRGALLENEHVRAVFYETKGKIKSLVDAATGRELVRDSNIWELQFVNEDGLIVVVSGDQNMEITQQTEQKLELEWKEINVTSSASAKNSALVTVSMFVELEKASTYLECSLNVEVVKTIGSDLGLWQTSILLYTEEGAKDEDGDLFFPAGLGRSYVYPTSVNSATSGYIHAVYPSGGASMQYMAVATDESYSSNTDDTATGLYMGAHDKRGIIKSFTYSSTSTVTVLNITTLPENAGMPFTKWFMPYPVAIGVVPGVNHRQGAPLWYQASQIYRSFIFSDKAGNTGGVAPWVGGKKIAERIPEWYRDTSIWLNSHWQCNDVFNTTGGDPSTVVKLASQVAEVLAEPSVALHWYEWGAYAFDTNYPDYFPSKPGFRDAVKALREGPNEIRTFPYTNGRIFDVKSDAYLRDNGAQYCSKEYPSAQLVRRGGEGGQPPQILTESYGSNATFCVASPHSPYWQAKISGVTAQLLEQEHTDGVYIDQIGASPPMACWDGDSEAMHHTNGGGTYWTQGYLDALRQIDTTSGGDAPIITEDCAEPYMGLLHGNLVLTSFRASLAQQSVYATSECPQVYKRMTPAYAAVYGGHYIAAGAEWFRHDFNDHNWVCGKLASQFNAGVVLGWIALAGLDYMGDQKCGPMGMGDLLLAPQHAPVVGYLKLLASARRAALPWLLEGRLGAPPVLSPAPQVMTQDVSSKGGGLPLLDYDSVSSSSWLLDTSSGSSSTLVLLTNNEGGDGYSGSVRVKGPEGPYTVSTKLMQAPADATEGGWRDEEGQGVTGSSGSAVTVKVHVPARSVLLVKLSPTDTSH